MAAWLYGAEGKNINDSWYIKHNGKYYAYYLQYPSGKTGPGRYTEQDIGCSVSDDLNTWEYCGTVLKPEKDIWCDKGLATGSITEADGVGYMLYTGNNRKSGDGIGLALTYDFINFERFGDKPVIIRDEPFYFPYKDTRVLCRILADPYVYPQPIDGMYYVFINCYAVERPIGKRGCIAVMRSRDLINYEPHGIALLSDEFDRLETPQVWYQSGIWAMYYGAVRSHAENGVAVDTDHLNMITTSDSMTEGYLDKTSRGLPLPDGRSYYIGKVVDFCGDRGIFIANIYPGGGFGPYYLEIKNGEAVLSE